jgi:uncharacterized protein YjlB
MPIGESVKKAVETVTGLGRPSDAQAAKLLRPAQPRKYDFTDDGHIPNNRLPMLVYTQAVALNDDHDPAAVFETLFHSNGWGDDWRNAIYDYVHYHSMIHEVLGVARGSARVRFGGNAGAVLDLGAGDVALLPAGTGHQRLSASDDFLVVGAYPPSGEYDECRGGLEDHARALRTIPQVALPEADPLFGVDGPMRRLWQS